MLKRKFDWVYYIGIFILGILTGMLTIQYLRDVFMLTNESFSLTDIFSTVFFSMRSGYREYLSLSNILLFRWIYLFFGVGIVVFSRSYMQKDKKYFGFILHRCKDFRNGLAYIYNNSVIEKLIFVFIYFAGIILVCFVTFDAFKVSMFECIYVVMFGISKVLQLEMINLIMFLIYLKHNVSFAFLSGFIVVTVMILTDILLPVSILFYDSNWMFFETIVMDGIMLMLLDLKRRHFKYKLK